MTAMRKTINFREGDLHVLEPFMREGTDELEALVGEVGEGPLASDAAQLRALVMVGARHVTDEIERRRYVRAVADGVFDETDRSLGSRRRGQRPSGRS